MIRIVKRAGLSKVKSLSIRAIAVMSALMACALFILILGHNPLNVYASMVEGALGNSYRFKEVIAKTIPLVVTSLGVSVAFRMKFWNIGGEGQIYMGAFAASLVAFGLKGLPAPVMLAAMAAAGIAGGAIWAVIPGFFKARFGTNETLFTLMMNYIALKWITHLQYGPWKDPGAKGFPKIAKFPENAIMPQVLGVHIGWIIALLLVVAVYIFIHHTKKGYEVSVVGESENTARYAGMNVRKIIISAVIISGGLCGLAGMIQASAINKTLEVGLTAGVGFTAIITSWLAQLSAPLIVVVSFLFAAMVQGGEFIQAAFQIPQSAALVLQGMILFFILGSEFFIQYRVIFDRMSKVRSAREDA